MICVPRPSALPRVRRYIVVRCSGMLARIFNILSQTHTLRYTKHFLSTRLALGWPAFSSARHTREPERNESPPPSLPASLSLSRSSIRNPIRCLHGPPPHLDPLIAEPTVRRTGCPWWWTAGLHPLSPIHPPPKGSLCTPWHCRTAHTTHDTSLRHVHLTHGFRTFTHAQT